MNNEPLWLFVIDAVLACFCALVLLAILFGFIAYKSSKRFREFVDSYIAGICGDFVFAFDLRYRKNVAEKVAEQEGKATEVRALYEAISNPLPRPDWTVEGKVGKETDEDEE